MRRQTFLIITALAPEPLHGYGIIKAVEKLSNGKVRLSPGTLYGAIDRLVNEGLVEPVGESVVSGRARRTYLLTDAGRIALRGEAEAMRSYAGIALERLAPATNELA